MFDTLFWASCSNGGDSKIYYSLHVAPVYITMHNMGSIERGYIRVRCEFRIVYLPLTILDEFIIGAIAAVARKKSCAKRRRLYVYNRARKEAGIVFVSSVLYLFPSLSMAFPALQPVRAASRAFTPSRCIDFAALLGIGVFSYRKQRADARMRFVSVFGLM